MTFPFFRDLARESLFAPRSAAGRILGMGLSAQWLWTALVLMAVLNAIVTLALFQVAPPGDPEMMALFGPALRSPLLVAGAIVLSLVMTIFALTWAGRAMGGTGQTADILAIVTWFQALQLVARLAIVLLVFAIPLVGALLSLVATVWGLVIFVAFLDRAHGFANIFKTVGVLVVAVIAILIGLSLIAETIGAVLVPGGA
ncbi:Yip1 family protein [Roseovarius spongiae]|nr:Yip1 family protein [Roseovarius spongiae]